MAVRTVSITDVQAPGVIRGVVSRKVPEKWRSANLSLTGWDDESTYSFFTQKTEAVRVSAVRRFFEGGSRWSPFIVQPVPKNPSWGKVAAAARARTSPWRRDPTQPKRTVAYDARVDHAAQLVLLDVLRGSFRRGTPANVIGFVAGVDPFDRLADLMDMIQAEPAKYRFARAYDLETAFDLLDWRILDEAIDQHLGEVVAGVPRVDEPLRRALKGLVRVELAHRDGTRVPRCRGVLQGAVLSPFLLNLYLRHLDRRVTKKAESLGCVYFRYADDILLAGPTPDALEDVSRFFENEVSRLKLRIKAGTGKTHDLVNPQNPVEWLGIEFTHTTAKVPRSRIETKAANLLLRLRRRQLGLHGLESSLDQLRQHYASLVGDDEATKAVEAVRRLLRPFLDDLPEDQGGISHIIEQLPSRTAGSARSRTTPGGGSFRPREGDPRRRSPSRSTWTPNELPAATGLQGPNDGGSLSRVLPSDTPHRRDSAAPIAASDTGSSSGSNQEMSSSSSYSSPLTDGLPLVAHSSSGPRPGASPEAKVQVRTDKNNSTPPRSPRPVVTVWVRRLGRGGRVVLKFSDPAITTFTFLTDASSAAEVVVEGYRQALERLAEYEGEIELRVKNHVVHGHVFSKDRIRSPFVLRRWIGLVPLLDDRVRFVDGSGVARRAGGQG